MSLQISKLFVLAIAIFSYCSAQAEYRVFLLGLQTDNANEVQFLSSLDDQQYLGYHTILPNQKIRYIDSWMCWGDTSFSKPYCPNPRNPASTAAPATDVATPAPTNPQ